MDWIGLLAGVVGVTVAVASQIIKHKYIRIAEVIISAINSLDQVMGEEDKKKVKRTVHRHSLVWDNEQAVHNAVKQAEEKQAAKEA